MIGSAAINTYSGTEPAGAPKWAYFAVFLMASGIESALVHVSIGATEFFGIKQALNSLSWLKLTVVIGAGSWFLAFFSTYYLAPRIKPHKAVWYVVVWGIVGAIAIHWEMLKDLDALGREAPAEYSFLFFLTFGAAILVFALVFSGRRSAKWT